jgi:hypothetical protein
LGNADCRQAGTRDELIVSSQGRVYAYSPDTGEPFWTVRGNLFEVIPTPVVGHGLVFCSSGRAGPTLAIRPGGKGDVTSTHVAWSSPRGSPFVPSGLVHGDYLYLVNDMQSILTVFEAATGTLMYQNRLGAPVREGFTSSPVAVDGVFYPGGGGAFIDGGGSDVNAAWSSPQQRRFIKRPRSWKAVVLESGPRTDAAGGTGNRSDVVKASGGTPAVDNGGDRARDATPVHPGSGEQGGGVVGGTETLTRVHGVSRKKALGRPKERWTMAGHHVRIPQRNRRKRGRLRGASGGLLGAHPWHPARESGLSGRRGEKIARAEVSRLMKDMSAPASARSSARPAANSRRPLPTASSAEDQKTRG